MKEDINVGNVFQHLAENYVNQVSLEQLLGVWGLLVALIGSLQCVGSRDQLSTVCPDDGRYNLGIVIFQTAKKLDIWTTFV